MQTAFQFFDIPTQSGFGAVDKVAVKMPGETDLDPSVKDFAAIMGALQQLAPEELQRSLEALDWVAVEGENNGYVPLIDLSNHNGIGAQVLTLLMEGPAAEGPAFSLSGDVVLKQFSELSQPMASGLATEEICDGQGRQAVQQAVHLLESVPPGPFTEAGPDVELPFAKPATVSAPAAGTNDPAPEVKLPSSKPALENTLAAGTNETAPEIKLPSAKSTIGSALATGTPEATPEVKLPSKKTATETLRAAGIKGEADDLQAKQVEMARSKPQPPPVELPRTVLNTAEQRNQAKTDGETSRQGAAANVKDNPGASTLAGQPVPDKNHNGAASLRQLAASHVQGAHSTAEQETVEEGKGDSGGKPNEPLDRIFQTHGGKANRGTLAGPENAKSMVHETAGREPAAPSREMQSSIIRQIVQRMTLRSSGLKSRMNVQLKPEFLGNLHMQITTEQHQVTVRMIAESVVVKEMVEQQLQHLRSELQQHGLEIDKFEVSVGNGSENWKSSQENAAFRRPLHHRRRGRSGQSGDGRGEDNGNVSDGDKMPLRSRTREIDYFA